uniref:AKNA domain-containing protein n=1 Tax=Anas platyrhynchos platyrhynchos TaxID=8840 RepID=U3J237_ANAPP
MGARPRPQRPAGGSARRGGRGLGKPRPLLGQGGGARRRGRGKGRGEPQGEMEPGSEQLGTPAHSALGTEHSASPSCSAGEQEELPYDGDEGPSCKCNSNAGRLRDCTGNVPHMLSLSCSEDEAAGTEQLPNAKMSNVLWRHFPEGELLNTGQLIECETIPEMSYTESLGETTNKPESYEHSKGSSTPEQWATTGEEDHLGKQEDGCTGGKNPSVLNEKLVSKRSVSSAGSCGCRHNRSQLRNKYEDTHLSHNTKEQREVFKKNASSHRLIHGDIHHCIPDFSEITTELKVPKINENIKSVPTTEPTKSFPILLCQSETVDNILESNCSRSVEVENQEMRIPELLQQLKALNQLKKYLDALERSYLTAREEHRVLQLQNYKDKSIHVGEFDPERKVEGEIFRLGMLLEDIQEQTDDCKYSLAPSLISDESAHSSNPLWESSVVPSITDPPEETTFLHKNKGENTSQTSDVIPQTNHLFSFEAAKYNLCPHMLQKRAESTSRREMEPQGKGYLLASKHSSSVMAVIQKTSQPVTLTVHKARNLWNMRLKVTEHSIQDYIKRKKDLYSDALEKAVINSNTGITNSLFSLVPCVEIKMLVQPLIHRRESPLRRLKQINGPVNL